MNEQTRTIDEALTIPPPGDERLRSEMALVTAKPSEGDPISTDLTRAQVLAKDLLLMPTHLHGQIGTIVSIIELARHWDMIPGMVARQTYTPRGGGFAFMSQLIHAVVEQRAPIKHRIRRQFGRIVIQDGVGVFKVDLAAPPEERRCRVWTTVKGEDEPIEYISPPFAKIQPKHSPLWVSDPDQQQFYRAVTMFSRTYFPDILMGCYTAEELAGGYATPDIPVHDPAAGLKERLGARTGPVEGMQVEASPQEAAPAPERKPVAAAKPKPAPTPPPKVDKRSKAYREAQEAARKKEQGSGALDRVEGPYDRGLAEVDQGHGPADLSEAHDPETGEVVDAPTIEAAMEAQAEQAAEAVEAAAEAEQEEEGLEPPKEPEPPALPQNQKEYKAHVKRWLADLWTDSEDPVQRSLAEQAIRDRWKSEMGLRNQCGLTSEDRKPITEAVNATIARLQPAEAE